MLSILWLAGMVAGFAFPACLITAIRSVDEHEAGTYTLLSCITFGICVVSILVVTVYS